MAALLGLVFATKGTWLPDLRCVVRLPARLTLLRNAHARVWGVVREYLVGVCTLLSAYDIVVYLALYLTVVRGVGSNADQRPHHLAEQLTTHRSSVLPLP
jgi:hypothetical protein